MATELPASVARTFERIRKQHRHASISVIRNGFYVVESVMRFSSELGRHKTYTLYLGKIERDGRFVEARHRKQRNNVSSVYRLVEAGEPKDRSGVDEKDRELLTMLGTDGRRPVAEMAKELGMSPGSVAHRMSKLERQLGLRYTAEVQTLAFGFSRFAVTVSFQEAAPPIEEMRKVLEPDPLVLLAFATKGQYDLMLIVIAENTVALEKWLYRTRSTKAFAGCQSIWNVSHLTQEEGYVPVREEFLAMLKERVWRRSRETPARLPGQLLPREYAVLRELSEDGRADFSGMDRKHGFGRGAALYTYNRLLERGMISRVTSLMLRPPIRYVAIFHLDQVNMQGFIADRKRYMAHVISESGRALDRYTLICGFGMPYGILLFAPVYEDSDMERIGKELDMGGAAVRSLIVTSTIVGSLGFRRFDMRSTSMYGYLKEESA